MADCKEKKHRQIEEKKKKDDLRKLMPLKALRFFKLWEKRNLQLLFTKCCLLIQSKKTTYPRTKPSEWLPQCQIYISTAKWQSNGKSNFLIARIINRVSFVLDK